MTWKSNVTMDGSQWHSGYVELIILPFYMNYLGIIDAFWNFFISSGWKYFLKDTCNPFYVLKV